MFGKLFSSMYDGSLHGHWKATIALQQLVILSNRHGEVDMTCEAIAARTGIPLEILRTGISELERPDPESRGPAEEGRRIVRLEPSRSWGWRIVNYLYYRNLATAEDKREGARERQKRHREKLSRDVTPRNAASRSSRHADAEAKAEGKKPKQADARFRVVAAVDAERLWSEPPFAALPLKGGRHEALLSKGHCEDLQRTYPTVRVGAQVLRMRQWLISNPGRAKTPSGVLRFVDSWLKGEAEELERIARQAAKAGGRGDSDAAYALELELEKERRRHA